MTAHQHRGRYYLHTDEVLDIIDTHDMNQGQVAELLAISRQYLNQLLNRRQTLTPKMRRRFLECELFADVDEASLWERMASREASPPPEKQSAHRQPRGCLPFPAKRHLMSRAAALFAVKRAGLSLAELGGQLGLAEAYWFDLSGGRIPVGRRRRRAIEQHPAFAGIPTDQLWVIAEIPSDPSTIQPVPSEVNS